MKKFKNILTVCLCAALAASAAMLAACNVDPDVQKPEYGKITGTVVFDDEGDKEGLEAEVYYTEEDSVECDEDGKFTINQVKVGEITLTAVLNGYADTQLTVTYDDFDLNGTANVEIVMPEGKGTVTGLVRMSGNTTVTLAGATVKINGTSFETTSDDTGRYTFNEVPMLKTYTMSISLAGYENGTKTVTKRSYSNGTATVNVDLVQKDLAELPGVKPYQIETMQPLSETQLAFGVNDISSYMQISANNVQGSSKVETHPEGICVNADTTADNGAIVAFIYAKVKIDSNHKFLTAYARQFFGQNNGDDHDTEAAAVAAGLSTPGKFAELGIYVIDEQGNINKNVGSFIKINTEYYMPATFDLSQYEGQTVTFVLGTKTGYHCTINNIAFTPEAPEYLTVNGVSGLDNILMAGKVAAGTFNAASLKANWQIGGGVGKVDEGIQLNGADPWKAVDYDETNPQPVNSYMYITTDITAATSQMQIDATIVNLENCKDPASEDPEHLYYPYICVIVLDKNGNVLTKTDWTKIEVSEDNEVKTINVDLSGCIGEDVTVIIAANVGYRATITGVTFGEAQSQNQQEQQKPEDQDQDQQEQQQQN